MTTPTETSPPVPETKPPKLDLRATIEKLNLPGVDPRKLIEIGRKDIEALLDANERAQAAVAELTRKQVDLLHDVMKEWRASAKGAIASTSGAERLNQAAEHAQAAFTHALTGMKELAEITARSSREVVGILNKRYKEAVEELKAGIRPKA